MTSTANEWTPERIRALRSRLGLSQTDFAQALRQAFPPLRTDAVTVSRWENGHFAPGGAAVYALDILDKS